MLDFDCQSISGDQVLIENTTIGADHFILVKVGIFGIEGDTCAEEPNVYIPDFSVTVMSTPETFVFGGLSAQCGLASYFFVDELPFLRIEFD